MVGDVLHDEKVRPISVFGARVKFGCVQKIIFESAHVICDFVFDVFFKFFLSYFFLSLFFRDWLFPKFDANLFRCINDRIMSLLNFL